VSPSRLSAELYDGFYDALDKDYRWEAGVVLRHVRRHLRRPRTLLDVACGTGRHLEVFAETLDCTGVDLDAEALAVARRRCPGVRFEHADLEALDLGRRFDVVTCLFSSIAYMPTVARLRSAVRALARHVEPGGVLVVEPWYTPDDWDDDQLNVLVVDEPDRKAVRTSRGSHRGLTSVLDFDFLVTTAAGSRRFHERHELRLFRTDQLVGAFEAAGLGVEVDPEGLFGHGLVVGTASSSRNGHLRPVRGQETLAPGRKHGDRSTRTGLQRGTDGGRGRGSRSV